MRGAGSSSRSEAAIRIAVLESGGRILQPARCSMRAGSAIYLVPASIPAGVPGKCPGSALGSWPVRAAAVLALALAAAACGSSRSPGSAGSPARDSIPAAAAAPLPPLEYRLRSGEPWTSHAALGRVLVIDVWATYCRPCRKALPKLGRLAAAHPEAVVIGISVDEEDAVLEAFLREVPVAFPIARDPEASVQSGPLAIHRLPTLLLVDRRGRIRFRGEEMAEPDYDVLPGLVAALLAE